MRLGAKSSFVLLAMVAAVLVTHAGARSTADVVWLDFDMQSIAEPKARSSSYYDAFFKGQLAEGWKKNLDAPRWIRAAARHPKPAANVNAVDEVPDSSWYTNRHHLRRMTIDELIRGPNHASPDFSQAVITRAKTGGVTPGLQVKDRNGDSYIIKFDNANYPELQSGAEMIATKILYAAGYNVPENYLGYIDAKQLRIGEDVEITDETQKKRTFTPDDLNKMLQLAARMPDGRYRVLASKFLPGKLKGPFPQIGLRRDDPNDLIPHEHRRELRGLRVIASWINHWDLKEENGLDTYIEENGRKFLRHYLIDFGSTLGAGQHPLEYFHGREYLFDFKNIMKDLFTLGVYVSPDEKQGRLISPEVGMFSADDFDPEEWKPNFPVMAFQNMTDEDAFWATRIILSFTEPELRSIVETAQYTDPRNTDYMLKTLLERRRIVARHWLAKVNPISDFTLQSTREGIVLKFQDMVMDCDCSDASSTEYIYKIKAGRLESEKKTIRATSFIVNRGELGAAIEEKSQGAPIEITIWAHRQEGRADPVKVYFYWTPARDTLGLRRIARG